jgi:hypothetical protein
MGTRQWALASNGALKTSERKKMLMQIMLKRAASIPKRVRRALGLSDPQLARIDIDAIRIPDSSAARCAGELVASLSQPWMVNHCTRTYLWGAMLAQSHRISFDEELLYVATALHDMGLSDSHSCSASCAACFAVEGARVAERFSDGRGWPHERRDRLSEAISLHLNVQVGLAQGHEAHLLHAGASVDIIGARLRELHVDSVRAVLARHPRLDFNAAMATTMKNEARNRPHSRAAFLVSLGLAGMIRESKWNL